MIRRLKRGAEWMGPWKEVIQNVMDETGLDRTGTEELSELLSRIDVAFQDDLVKWWRTKQIDLDRTIKGYSLRRLMKEGHISTVVEGFTWMHVLLHDFQLIDILRMTADRDPACCSRTHKPTDWNALRSVIKNKA